jgi:Ca2+:H+ antiporter
MIYHRNAVVLTICIVELVRGEVDIVQAFVVGSMLSNLLLTVGMSFFFGGLNHLEQYFNAKIAQFTGSLLALAIGGLVIPTAFTWGNGGENPTTSTLDESVSRGTSIILISVYLSYLVFQLTSHREMYNAPSQRGKVRMDVRKVGGDMKKASAPADVLVGDMIGGRARKKTEHILLNDKTEPTLTIYVAIVIICSMVALIGFCALSLVESLPGLVCRYNVSENYFGLVLLPIASNMAELFTAFPLALRDKMDLIIGVAIGSSIQIALFVFPLTVIVGWIIGVDITLIFGPFQIVILFATVILVNYLIADGKSRKSNAIQDIFFPQNRSVGLSNYDY